jgi:hypothetical protein
MMAGRSSDLAACPPLRLDLRLEKPSNTRCNPSRHWLTDEYRAMGKGGASRRICPILGDVVIEPLAELQSNNNTI